jgi:hypothetical protein
MHTSKYLKEDFYARNTVRGNYLYFLVIAILLIGIALLPVIKVPVTVAGRGMILENPVDTLTDSTKNSKIAEIYILGKDIACLYEKQAVTIQVDAFNYNRWGNLKTTITSIADEYIILENTPFFKVICELPQEYLELNNGKKALLRSGMTVSARFVIARRSLLQLLCQKTDAWLDPSITKN